MAFYWKFWKKQPEPKLPTPEKRFFEYMSEAISYGMVTAEHYIGPTACGGYEFKWNDILIRVEDYCRDFYYVAAFYTVEGHLQVKRVPLSWEYSRKLGDMMSGIAEQVLKRKLVEEERTRQDSILDALSKLPAN